MSEREQRTTGATAGAGAPPRRPWWLWLVLAILVLAALLFALSRCGQGTGTDPSAGGAPPTATNPPAAPPAAAAPTTAAAPSTAPAQAATPAPASPTAQATPAPAAGGGGEAGSLTAGGAALLPLAQAAGADGSLAGRAGQEVTGDGVRVESVPADEGFWVGTSATDRIWVQLEGTGESSYTVRPGDRVSFTGRLVENPAGFAGRNGVDPGEGAEQLDRQGAHITVPQTDLRLAAR